jgi:hypothetical protein
MFFQNQYRVAIFITQIVNYLTRNNRVTRMPKSLPTTVFNRQPKSRAHPTTLSKNQPTQPEINGLGAPIGSQWRDHFYNPSRKSQEQWGRDHSLNLLASTKLNKWGSVSLSKSCLFQKYMGVFIQGTTLLVGCEKDLEFIEISYVKGHHVLKSRTTSCGCWPSSVQSPLNRS